MRMSIGGDSGKGGMRSVSLNEYRITLNTRCGIGRAFVVIDRSILELVSQLLRRSLIVEDLLRDILQSNEHAL